MKAKININIDGYLKEGNMMITFNGKSKGDERVLSNYYPFDFNVGGVEFHSVEQYYHYRRLRGHPQERKKILTYTGENNAHLSRHYAHIRTNKGKLIMDEEKRIDIMRDGLQYKFKYCKEFRDYLLSTGSKTLVEVAPWGDSFWGTINSVDEYGNKLLEGRNILGKLLMELRTEAKETSFLTPVEPPTVEVAPTIQPKQDEPTFPDLKTLYTAKEYSDLSNITGVFQVTKRDDTCTKTEYPTNYKKALEIYNRFCDDLEKSSNPSFANVTLNNNIIHCRLYETTVDIGELPF